MCGILVPLKTPPWSGSPPADLRAVFQESEVLKTRKESYQEKLEEYNARLREAVSQHPNDPHDWWLNDDRHGEYIYEIYEIYDDRPWWAMTFFFCRVV